MIVPLSAKPGFMILGSTHIPIYNWNMSLSKSRIIYRASNTNNFPKRLPGWKTETISMTGPDVVAPSITTTSNIFKLGWFDYTIPARKSILCQAVPLELRYILRYEPGPAPSFTWTYNLLGILNNKGIEEESLLPYNDSVICATSLCDKPITTTDTDLHGGFVWHVRTATIITTYSVPSYPRSDTDNHVIGLAPVYDQTVELVVQGDFDYWLNELSRAADIRNNYRFYYGTGLTHYKAANNMRVTDINNFIVNIQTGEIIQMTIMLGASYE